MPKVFRRSISRAQGSTKLAALACSSKGAGTVRSHRMEGDTIQALMELALPQFGGLGNRSAPARKPWMVSTHSPASPDPVCSMDLARSPSPCLNLDTLSSDDAEESVIPHDISVTLLCGSEDGHTRLVSIRSCRMRTCRLHQIREIGGRFYGLNLSSVDWYTMTIMLYYEYTHSSRILSSQSNPNYIQNINKCPIINMICMILTSIP